MIRRQVHIYYIVFFCQYTTLLKQTTNSIDFFFLANTQLINTYFTDFFWGQTDINFQTSVGICTTWSIGPYLPIGPHGLGPTFRMRDLLLPIRATKKHLTKNIWSAAVINHHDSWPKMTWPKKKLTQNDKRKNHYLFLPNNTNLCSTKRYEENVHGIPSLLLCFFGRSIYLVESLEYPQWSCLTLIV